MSTPIYVNITLPLLYYWSFTKRCTILCLPRKSATNSYLSTPTSQSKALQQCHLIHRDSAVPRTPTSFFPVANAGLVLFPSESSSLSPRASRNLKFFLAPRVRGLHPLFPPSKDFPPICQASGVRVCQKKIGSTDGRVDADPRNLQSGK